MIRAVREGVGTPPYRHHRGDERVVIEEQRRHEQHARRGAACVHSARTWRSRALPVASAALRCPRGAAPARHCWMSPSSVRMLCAQLWWDSTRSRPARAKRSRSAGFSSSERMASRISSGVSATSRCSPGTASTPPAAQRLVTTGTPSASDSRILFCVPRAIASGAMLSAARCA